ncbi:T9SS C-terminal target domain-containing protein [Flavobacteriaceae bacterium AU392]|nr:T9SS C-terminal target domain-containing protein [Flavobacteriaceae bacterium]RKM84816.1 T9SS C-terminal target domain-containing protein [Flavobacteriaceae bacterium AU392]
MKRAIFLLLFPLLTFSQIQIGDDINGDNIGDLFGNKTAISSDGTIIAIGAPGFDINPTMPGYVRILENQSGIWNQIGNDINGDNVGDLFGNSISLSANGNIIAIGADESDKGYVRIFQYDNVNDIWNQIGSDINGQESGDTFGNSVSLSDDGTILAIGSINSDNGSLTEIDFGRVQVYENQLGVWTQIGQNLDGTDELDLFGESVSLSSDGSIVAIGADIGNLDDSGYVRIYKFNTSTDLWEQIGDDIDGEAADDFSGFSISLSADGNIIAIGAGDNDGVNGIDSGHVRVYENQLDTWIQIGQDIDGEAADDLSGESVDLSANGNVIAIGSFFNSDGGLDSGHVRIYEFNISTNLWEQIGNDINGEAADDFSGTVSLSSDGTTLIIGSEGNNGDVGYARVFDLSTTLSINDFELENFVMYPNPTSDIINIELNQGSILEKVNIYNTLGQMLQTQTINRVDLSKLTSGNYYVEVITDKGKTTKQIIVD